LAIPIAARADEATADSSDASQAKPAQAQTTEKKQQIGIEEITVTARKREENLQSTPVSVSAFSAEDLKDNDVRRLNEITRTVPNLQFDNAIGTANSARIYLRGVGTGDPISSRDPGVGLYLDGAYLPRQQSSLLTLSDLERVEVLRGPQGTLFGKNTIGGAINIVSKKPDIGGDFGADTEFRAGNFGRFDSRVSIDIPLVDEKAAARLSLATATRDPVVRNKGTGPELQDDKLLAGRFQFRWEPSDDLSFNLSFDQSKENRKPQGGKCVLVNSRSSGITINQATGLPTRPGEIPGSSEQGIDLNGNGRIENSPAAIATSAVVGLSLRDQVTPVNPADPRSSPIGGSVFDVNGVNDNFFKSCRQDGIRDNRDVASNVSFYKDNLKTMGSIGNIDMQLNDNLTLKSITAYRRNDTKNRGDVDYTELNLLDSTSDAGGGKQISISEELQLVGSALDDKFNFVVGGFAFHENNRDRSYGGVATQTNLSFSGTAASFTAPTSFVRNAAGQAIAVLPQAPGGARIQTRLNPASESFVAAQSAQFRRQFLFDQATRSAYSDSVFTIGADGKDRLATGAEVQATADATRLYESIALEIRNAQPGLTDAQVTQAAINDARISAQQRTDLNRILALPGAMTQVKLKTTSTSFAAFTQGTYDITDKLSATAGLRFTMERKFVNNQILAMTDGVIGAGARQAGEIEFQFARSERFTDLSPMANLSYQATDDLFFYTTYSKAFKSGGFNGRANSPDLTDKIDDEKLTAYEFGFKSKWLDNRLVVNGAAYFNRYTDIQLTIPSAGQGQAAIKILNVGENDIKGAELEVVAVPIAGLQLTASGGFLNARYREFIDPTNNDADNRRLPSSPTYTYNLGAGYEFPVGNMGDLRLHAEWAGRGKSATDVVNTRELDRSKSGELAAQITWALSDGVTEIGLFGKNLLNREYFINGVSLDASFGHAYRFYNEPRQYGVELRRSF
jgi:outer membrane receptor protein involved in Fe transport